MLTAERLHKLLDYNPETGIFRWRIHAGGRSKGPGSIAGYKHSKGYWEVKLDQVRYFAHRLAWFYVYGRWPRDQIDHRNGAKSDNRISNLREATPALNAHNQGLRRDNKSGHKGVFFDPRQGRWRAQIYVAGKHLRLGSFMTRELASQAYAAAAVRHYGDFARLS